MYLSQTPYIPLVRLIQFIEERKNITSFVFNLEAIVSTIGTDIRRI